CLPPTPSPHTYTLSLHDALPISPLLIWRPDTETSMTSPATPEARMRSVKIIHGALMAGVSLFLLVTVWLHRVSARAPLPVSGEVLAYVGLGILAAGLLALRFLPVPDPAPAPGQATDQWWMKSQGRLLVRWAVVEGGCLV